MSANFRIRDLVTERGKKLLANVVNVEYSSQISGLAKFVKTSSRRGTDMYTSDVVLGDRGYESGHIESVLSRIRKNFQPYSAQFASNARESFSDALKRWEKAHPDYVEILDDDFLKEYEDDAKAFKNALGSKCPIIRRSLNSPQEEMKRYKKAFYLASGRGTAHDNRENRFVRSAIHGGVSRHVS